MATIEELKNRYYMNLREGNLPEAHYEWKCLLGKQGAAVEREVVGEAEFRFHTLHFHLENRNLDAMLESLSWFENNLKNYQKDKMAEWGSQIAEPVKLIGLLHEAIEADNSAKIREFYIRLEQIGWVKESVKEKYEKAIIKEIISDITQIINERGSTKTGFEKIKEARNLMIWRFEDLERQLKGLERELIQHDISEHIEEINKSIKNEKFDRALDIAQSVKKRFPNDTGIGEYIEILTKNVDGYRVFMEKARLLLESSEFDKSLEQAERAYELFPTNKCQTMIDALKKKIATVNKFLCDLPVLAKQYDMMLKHWDFWQAFKIAWSMQRIINQVRKKGLIPLEKIIPDLEENKKRINSMAFTVISLWIIPVIPLRWLLKKLNLRG